MSSTYQKSFAAGEITGDIYGNITLQKYATGLRTCRNFFIARHGGAFNRTGSEHCLEFKDMTRRNRLIPFKAEGNSAYLLEFGHQYVRILKNDAVIPITAKSISLITKAAAALILTTVAHGFVNGEIVGFTGVVGMTEINGLTGTVTVVSPYTFTVNINSTGFTTYSSAGTVTLSTPRNVEFVTPWSESDLPTLTFSQSERSIVFANQSALPKELVYLSEESWTFADVVIDGGISIPGTLTNDGGVGTAHSWVVTAVKAKTLEESLPSTATLSADAPTALDPINLNWADVSGAIYYNIYRGGIYGHGFIGISYISAFADTGLVAPDYEDSPPTASFGLMNSGDTDHFAAAVGHAQQRRFFGNIGPAKTNILPSVVSPEWDPRADRILTSRVGSQENFNYKLPIEDDGAIIFRLIGDALHEIRHFLDIGRLAVFTAQGEWIIEGDGGAITATSPSPRQFSSHGSGYLPPIKVDGGALFVQSRGSIVRSFGFEFQSDGYRGNDLTIFSAHLVDGYEIQEWAHQKMPHSIVWMIRDDGTLLGLTFVPEQQLLAWHRHDFENGVVETVCTIPDGNEDVLYLGIKRTINGATVRYIEKLASRQFGDIRDAIFMDSAVTFDGRAMAANSPELGIGGGTLWDETELLVIANVPGIFTDADFANGVITGFQFDDGTGGILRFEIDSITNANVLLARPNKTVPVAMRNIGHAPLAFTANNVQGLDHLEGQQVSVFADGFVISSPNNSDYEQIVVTGGEINLGEKSYGVIHVGLPITADIETLNIDSTIGETLVDKRKLITKVNVIVKDTRGLYVGGMPPDDDSEDPREGLTTALYEATVRAAEDYDEPIGLRSNTMEVNIQPQWNSHGRIIIRQIDPLPAGILAVAPAGVIPIGGV